MLFHINMTSWSRKNNSLPLSFIFFLENCPEVSTNYNTFKYSIIHVFRKYQLLVKILRTKLTTQVVYKIAFAIKPPRNASDIPRYGVKATSKNSRLLFNTNNQEFPSPPLPSLPELILTSRNVFNS